MLLVQGLLRASGMPVSLAFLLWVRLLWTGRLREKGLLRRGGRSGQARTFRPLHLDDQPILDDDRHLPILHPGEGGLDVIQGSPWRALAARGSDGARRPAARVVDDGRRVHLRYYCF
jgi:hypothetical protein